MSFRARTILRLGFSLLALIMISIFTAAVVLPAQAQADDAPAFALIDGAINGRIGGENFVLEPPLENVVFSDLSTPETPDERAFALGYVDDGTDNIVLGWPSYAHGEFSLSIWYLDGAVRGRVATSAASTFRDLDASMAFSAIIPSRDPDHAYVYRVTFEQIEAITPPLNFAIGEDGEWVLPELERYESYVGQPPAASVQSIEGLTLRFSGGWLSSWSSPNESPQAEIVHRSFAEYGDAQGLYAVIDGVEIPLEAAGTVYDITPVSETQNLYTMLQSGTPADSYRRVYSIYLVDEATLEVVRLFEADDLVLDGDTAITPDGEYVLFTAFSDPTGAGVWRIEIPHILDYVQSPLMIVNNLTFYADAGNFLLPVFAEITNETFTLQTTQVDFSGDEPVSINERRTYTLDGELLSTEPVE